MTESSCCAVARKLGSYKCPICRKPIRLAKVLRLLRSDAQAWWWFKTLRQQGRVDEAAKLERQSIRNQIAFIRANIGRPMRTIRLSVIDFPVPVRRRPFDLSNMSAGNAYTAMVSGCHPGSFAAWVYCYANRIGLKFTAKQFDLV